MRGDDAARLLEAAEFESDRRAGHRVLPFEGDRERAHPTEPKIAACVLRIPGRCLPSALRKGSSGPNNRVNGRVSVNVVSWVM